jgi:methylated-DNA-[protein]-cysteine S-methyltransferase
LTPAAFGFDLVRRPLPGYDGAMASDAGFALFATALGDCAVAWNELGLTGVWLPDTSAGRLRSRLTRRSPRVLEALPPAPVAAAIAAVKRLLAGERTDLLDIRIDDSGLDGFDRRVYAAAREIAPGRVATYATLAARVGGVASARAVGQSLGRNPFPIVVPCHRVVAADGELGGFSAPGGSATKRRLLRIENARLEGPADLFDSSETAAAGRAPSA